jgi:hypothetical protein
VSCRPISKMQCYDISGDFIATVRAREQRIFVMARKHMIEELVFSGEASASLSIAPRYRTVVQSPWIMTKFVARQVAAVSEGSCMTSSNVADKAMIDGSSRNLGTSCRDMWVRGHLLPAKSGRSVGATEEPFC